MSVTLSFNVLGYTLATVDLDFDSPETEVARLEHVASRVATSAFDKVLNQAVKKMTRWWTPRMTSHGI